MDANKTWSGGGEVRGLRHCCQRRGGTGGGVRVYLPRSLWCVAGNTEIVAH